MSVSAITVEELPALIQERLRQLQQQLFPQRLRLQVDDRWLRARQLPRGRAALPPPEVVPLPEGICRQGMPQNRPALGDFLGDWLLEQGLVAAQLEVVLPSAACQWRVVAWPFADQPDDPLQALRQLQLDLGPSLNLDRSYLGWQPLPPTSDEQAQTLLVAAPKAVVEAWQEVFSVAGVAVQRLIPAQVLHWRALQTLWSEESAAEHWFVELDPASNRLWLVVDGVPEADWPLPAWPAGGALDPNGDAALNPAFEEALRRCQLFWRQQRANQGPDQASLPAQRWRWYASSGSQGGVDLPEQANPLASLVQPWPLEPVLLADHEPGWDPGLAGLDLLQETRSDQPLQEGPWVDWRPPLRRGAAVGAALVAAMALAAAGLAALQVSNRAEIARLLPVQAMADGLQARLQRQRRQLRLLQRGNQALADGLVAVRSGSALLEDLRRRTPVGVQITELRVEPTMLHLKGRAADPQAFARINALQLELQASPLFQPDGVELVKANRDGASDSAAAPVERGRQPVMFELSAAFAERPVLLDGAQLRALGAEGMAQRRQMLQRAGVLP